MRGFGARDHLAIVHSKELLAPHFLRVRLISASLFEDVVLLPTAWLRFWFPDPDGGNTEFQRAYTITEANPETGEFAVDFVLHEPAGPASVWAQGAQHGDQIALTSLGSSKFLLPDELPAGYLLIGDSASIPAINSILAVLPGEVPVELYLEQHDGNDQLIPLTEHPRTRVHWVPRRGANSLAAALPARDWSDWYAWVGCESGSMKPLRQRLREEFGFPKSEVYLQAYWFEGRAMGKLRGTPPAASSEIASTAEDQLAEPMPEPVEASASLATQPESTDLSVSEPTPSQEPKGSWRAQAAGRLLAPLRTTLILSGILQAIVTLTQLAPFVLMVELARQLISGADSVALWTLGVTALLLMGVGALLGSALLFWLHLVDARFEKALRLRLLNTFARLPLGWFTARGSGAIKKLVQDDTLSLHYLVTHAVPDAVAAVVAPVAVLGYLFAVDWRLALVLFIPVVIYALTMSVMAVQSSAKTAQAMQWKERMNTEATSYLEGQPIIRVFGGAAASSFRARLSEYIAFLNDWQRPFVGKKTLMDLVTRPATSLWLIMVIGTPLVLSGSLIAVNLLPFLLLGTTFGARLLGIGYGLGGVYEGMLAARRVQVALDEPTLDQARLLATTEKQQGQSEQTGKGLPVDFQEVSFSYRSGVQVLQQVSLTLRPGTVTALVGPSGSGKSTIAALLARFYDVESGSISVDGQDIRSMSADQLYRQVGFVLQDVQLIQGTVRENIALAKPTASQEQIESAAQAAQIHQTILGMPRGYDTEIGADSALSGGEKQRLTIARAILADTPVLVLDEATAFADPESEFLVQQALNRLTAERTVLVIAHRLHTVMAADQIVVLEQGRVVETGSHAGLFAASGAYRELWDAGQSALDQPQSDTLVGEPK